LIPAAIIQKKKVGAPVSKEEMDFMVKGYIDGSIPDYQISAFLMAVYFKGMADEEIFNMTDIMLNSGAKADFKSISGFKIDKHSTGGVGDKVSLILAPIVAACGLYVPMISGRSLGITGGTLDKLESIPGYRTRLELNEFESIVGKIGLCLAGQTEKLVPGDKKIYALRDVTSTVDSIPLICASIISKKVAEGIDSIVFDIKVGSGAFMREVPQAEMLGEKLAKIAGMFGKKTSFMLSDMNSPLGYAVGNWLEVVESVHCLRGMDVKDLMEVTYQLAGMMLTMGGKSADIESGILLAKEAIKSGKAYQKFLEMVEIQGGDISYIENLEKQNIPKHSVSIEADEPGYISAINAYSIGLAGIDLGVGRKYYTDEVDPLAGIVFKKVIGDEVSEGDELAVIYSNREIDLRFIREFIKSSFLIEKKKVEKQTKIISIDGNYQ